MLAGPSPLGVEEVHEPGLEGGELYVPCLESLPLKVEEVHEPGLEGGELYVPC